MPTQTEIRDAYQSLVANNSDPAVVEAARQLRRAWRNAADDAADLTAARAFFSKTPAQISADQPGFQQAIADVLAALPNMTWDPGGGVGVKDLRDRLRALVGHANSAQWLKDACEVLKRTKLLTHTGGTAQYDQEATDPIEVAATAAVALLGAGTTLEELNSAFETLRRYRELTPDQPPL